MKIILNTVAVLSTAAFLLTAGCNFSKEKTTKVNVRTVCEEGIMYFTTISNNPFYGDDINAAKIDPKTLKPMTCN